MTKLLVYIACRPKAAITYCAPITSPTGQGIGHSKGNLCPPNLPF
jgi:hypothetical protein